MMPLPVSATPFFIDQVAADPSVIICHALRSSLVPMRTVASDGGGAGVAGAGAGVTTVGCGRFASWIFHFPLGCIGVSSYPTGAGCCPEMDAANNTSAIVRFAPPKLWILIAPPNIGRVYPAGRAAERRSGASKIDACPHA